VAGVLITFLLYLLGLLPFIPLSYDVFSCPLYTTDFENVRRNPKTKLPWFLKFAFVLMKCFHCLAGPLFSHLQKRGIPVFVWVLNDHKDFKEALSVK